MINDFCNEVVKIYDELVENNVVRKLGIINHDIFKEKLYQLGNKYNLLAKKEYCGIRFKDIDTDKIKRGRIDLVYYKDNIPYIALEIDSGLKKSSVKKLVANNNFKYRIWFCYKKNLNMCDYKKVINTYDNNKELIYLLPK